MAAKLPAKAPKLTMADIARELAEKTRLQANRPNLFGYVPHAKQLMFHSQVARHRLYIGGNRSGKTTGGIIEDIWWMSGTHPYRETPQGGVRGRIVGVDFTQGIEAVLKPEFIRWCPPSYLRGGSWSSAYDKQTRTVYFENGSFCEFMSYDQDVDKFAGTSRHFVHFDEEPPQEIFLECLARLIDTGGSWWMTLTPIMGMEWMYDDIYTVGKEDTSETPLIGVTEVSMHENPHLGEVEVAEFLAMLSEDDKDARVAGKFIRRGGLIYKEFDYLVHTIDPLEEINPYWELYMSIDHGYNNPTAVYWHAVDSDGDVITFYEHYAAEMVVQEHAARIKEINATFGISPGINVCDPAMSQRNPVTGDSIIAEYAKHGVYLVAGNNDVITGINKINTYLKPWGPGGRPKWRITRNCVELVKELKKYRWKTWANKTSERTNNKYDQPHKKDDHGCDSCRYFFTLMPDLKPIVNKELPSKNVVMASTLVTDIFAQIDTNLRSSKVPNTEWHTETADDYMGNEW